MQRHIRRTDCLLVRCPACNLLARRFESAINSHHRGAGRKQSRKSPSAAGPTRPSSSTATPTSRLEARPGHRRRSACRGSATRPAGPARHDAGEAPLGPRVPVLLRRHGGPRPVRRRHGARRHGLGQRRLRTVLPPGRGQARLLRVPGERRRTPSSTRSSRSATWTIIEKHINDGEFHVETKVQLRGTLNKRDDKDKGWSVEGRIPWADFLRTGGRPEPGETVAVRTSAGATTTRTSRIELSCDAPIAEKKLSAVLPPDRGLRHAHVRRPGREDGEARSASRSATPLTTSTVVGSPDPPPPYRVERALPELHARRTRSSSRPSPAPTSCSSSHENRPWADDDHLARQGRPGDAKTADAVKLLDTPGRGTAYDFAFHPKFAENGYVYVGWNGEFDGGKARRRHAAITRYTMKTKPPLTHRREVGEDDHRVGVGRPQRGRGLLRQRRHDLRHHRRRHLRLRHRPTWASGPTRCWRRCCASTWITRPTGKAYSRAEGQPVRRRQAVRPGDVGLRPAQPVADHLDAKTGHIWVGQNGQDLWEQAYLVRRATTTAGA